MSKFTGGVFQSLDKVMGASALATHFKRNVWINWTMYF